MKYKTYKSRTLEDTFAVIVDDPDFYFLDQSDFPMLHDIETKEEDLIESFSEEWKKFNLEELLQDFRFVTVELKTID